MEYEIIRRKIKNIYIQVKDGRITVRAPYKVKEKDISKLINEKKEWIEKQLLKQEKKNAKKENGLEILGKVYPIVEHKSDNEYIEINENKVDIYLNDENKKNDLIKQLYRKCAQKQYIITTQKMMEKTGLEPNSWRVKDIQYAWGSCTNKKNITLSLNLIKKREEIIEYVVVHELCHLKYMNHSKEFWSLVEKHIPNYKAYRKELKA